nr:reverse transcriptase domain-containing protein [Tanacetum cinerariifolium]
MGGQPSKGSRITSDQGGRGNGSNGCIDEVPDFSTVIAQQLQDLLPTIITQVGGHIGNQWINESQNDNAVEDSIHEDVRNVNLGFKSHIGFNDCVRSYWDLNITISWASKESYNIAVVLAWALSLIFIHTQGRF